MRMPALVLAVLAATLLMDPASAQDGANLSRQEELQPSANKLRELQKERIATLKKMADVNASLFRSGQGPFEAVLEAAEKESDPITLYQNLAKMLKQYEEVARQRVKAGQGTEASILKVKARLLAAEIHLAQAAARNPDLEQHKIVVTSPRAKDVLLTQQYPCQIHSRRHIKIRSLQRGYLEEVLVKEGQAVKKGDVLFKIFPALYRAKLEAELAEVRLAELELKNAEKLFQKKTITQLEVARFQAKLAQAQARVKLAEAELSFTMIRAPFDGIIDR